MQSDGTRSVAVIDWHTGVGSYGEPFYLCFNDIDSPAFERAVSWWGEDVRRHAGGFGGFPRADYRGLVFHGIQAALPHADVTGAVIEFGTFPAPDTVGALMVDRWLRFVAAPDDPEREHWARYQLGMLYPDDPAWRRSVEALGVELQDRALDGLAGWAGA